ncbi:helix-turn-helix transcriptional regulator [Streptomyces laculatispora]|nr:helix-turn-helix transcriptional regulator [Streptomyces laculatispora]
MDDSRTEDEPAPSVVYAAALREVVSGFTARGGTQKAIALAVHISPAALSRYLNGERVAPPEFLDGLWSFLAGQDHPWKQRHTHGWRTCAAGRIPPVAPRPSGSRRSEENSDASGKSRAGRSRSPRRDWPASKNRSAVSPANWKRHSTGSKRRTTACVTPRTTATRSKRNSPSSRSRPACCSGKSASCASRTCGSSRSRHRRFPGCQRRTPACWPSPPDNPSRRLARLHIKGKSI